MTPEQRRAELTRIAASMVRLEGGCEKGHRPGQWHIHQEPFHAMGRRVANIARFEAVSATPDPRVERLEAALRDMLGEVGFMRSCIASGERLSRDDLDRQDEAMGRAVALLRSPQERSGE